MIRTHPMLAAVLVMGFALFVFWRVGVDYARRGRLTLVSAVLQFVVFFLHGLSSYSFVDSRFSAVPRGSLLFPLALGLMVIGLVAAFAGMGQLSGGDTLGRSVTALRQSGIYRFSRNPQLMAYFVFLAGYALLWPSWSGLAWLAVYGAIAHVMVLTEERHLARAFGPEYESYRRRTSRYLGLPEQP